MKIFVVDKGIGIFKKHHESIFEDGFEIPDQRSHAMNPHGQHMGLSLARNICNSMGAKIMVSSFPEQGTTFTLEI
jgi:signal transduction histidine kinase